MLLVLLAACGTPTATVMTANHPDAPRPAALTGVVDTSFQRPIQTCYEEALSAQSDLSGTVSYRVMGSHGILKAEVTTPGPPALEKCATQPMSNQRLMRKLGDGDHMVGFVIKVEFDPEG